MILFEILRRDKFQRFALTLRQEGLRSALRKTARYLKAKVTGNGLTSLYRKGAKSSSTSNYLSGVWLELAEQGAFHVSSAPAVLRKRRKIAMIGDLNLPQCRKYRIEQIDEIWRQDGVEYSFSHYEDVPRSIDILQDATHVMLYRLASTPITSMLMYEARRLRLPILYDIDDPLFSVSAYGTYHNMKALPEWQQKHFINEAPRYLDVMNGAELISVSTPGLVEHARKYTERPVHLRRNFADRASLDAGRQAMNARSSGNRDQFRVCFASGSQGHEIDFAEIQADLISFLAGAPGRKLLILGHFNKSLLPGELKGRVEQRPFSTYDAYLRHLASADVAIMPLADDIFNRCKSGVRVIDAASVGVPSIVGQVSDMAAMVEDGRSGRIILPDTSWLNVLESMAADREATLEMGKNARQTLENNWSARLEHPVIDPELVKWVRV